MCTDLGIIRFLADNKDSEVYQKDIEHHLSLTAPSVSNKLRDLEKKNLINREYSKVDTRLKQVIMTDTASDIDVKMREEIENFENRIEALYEALIDLMASKDISKISIAELTKKADINRKTFYYHYETFSNFVDEIVEGVSIQLTIGIKEALKKMSHLILRVSYAISTR